MVSEKIELVTCCASPLHSKGRDVFVAPAEVRKHGARGFFDFKNNLDAMVLVLLY